MRKLYFQGRELSLGDQTVIGEGFEGVVHKIQIGGATYAIKVYRLPTDEYYQQGSPAEQRANQLGAQKRLALAQEKIPAFPKQWSPRVITPLAPIITAPKGGKVAGFGMNWLQDGLVLRSFAKLRTRPPGVDTDVVRLGMLDLWSTTDATHRQKVVFGDFNYLNILLKLNLPNVEAYVVDADNAQFGKYLCAAFMTKFVDPLICKPEGSGLIQAAPHTEETDWYALGAMYFEVAVRVPIFGGTYEPPSPAEDVPHDQRPLHGIAAWHKHVKYPPAAVPLTHVHDDLMQHFHEVVEKKKRGIFPKQLLERIRWVVCPGCGKEHCRPRCPECAAVVAPPAAVRETITGKVRCLRVLHTAGILLRAAVQQERLHMLWHVNGDFVRGSCRYDRRLNDFVQDPESVLMSGAIDPAYRFGIQGDHTLIAKGERLIRFTREGGVRDQFGIDVFRDQDPVFEGNAEHVYWADEGHLWRDDQIQPFMIGDTLPRQTRIWTGERFGFGIYQAGGVRVPYVFDAQSRGVNDTVRIPTLRGTILDMSCTFEAARCWFFAVTEFEGRTVTRCYVIRPDGTVAAEAGAEDGDGSWLDGLQGRCAAALPGPNRQTAHVLFAATDKGAVRVHERDGRLEVGAEFPDTERFVNSGHALLFSSAGLYVIDRREIRCIQMLI